MSNAIRSNILSYEDKLCNGGSTESIDGEATQALGEYMDQGYAPPDSWQKSTCCGSRSFLCCKKCYRLLVPREDWPKPVQDGSLQLPFDLHILLEDRETQSSGVQLKSVLDAAAGAAPNYEYELGTEEREDMEHNNSYASSSSSSSRVKVFNLEHGEMPPYSDCTAYDAAYLLFPGTDSIPLSKLLQEKRARIKTLVVLDCRWSHSSARFHPDLASLPKVSLDHPPAQSYYWRWHNTGAGMLSTAEATYFAAWQILTASLDIGWTLEERKGRLVHLLYLFRLQRALIEQKYARNEVQGINPHLPFSEEGKEFSRKLRENKKNKKKQKISQQQENANQELPS